MKLQFSFLKFFLCLKCCKSYIRYNINHDTRISNMIAYLAKSKFSSAIIIPEPKTLVGPIISYYTIANQSPPFETLYVIKNSKFITKILYAHDVDDAVRLVNKYKDEKASHNCWAYRDKFVERANDDGEPSGTAGRPILSAIKELRMVNTLILVTRFFGGIKLGTGGLSRAYATAAQQVLSECQKLAVFETLCVNVISKTNDLGALYKVIESINNFYMTKGYTSCIERLEDEIYNLSEDSVILNLRIHSFLLSELKTKIIDVTKGRGCVVET